MVGMIVLVLTALVFGVLFGGFLMVSLAIRRDDRSSGLSSVDAHGCSAQTARKIVGVSSSRWH